MDDELLSRPPFKSTRSFVRTRDRMLDCSELGNYKVQNIIGSGSFATVYLAVEKITERNVAIKAINMSRLNQKLAESLSTEISIMKKINHPNIVKLLDIKKQGDFIYLIMEYCSGGDLAGLLKQKKILSENTVKVIVRQLASALEQLRLYNIVHRDLKPHNLLLSPSPAHSSSINFDPNYNDLIIKVADFGFARSMMNNDLAQTLCGSPLYMAPEILRYEKYDAKTDLWSLGAIMFEMLYGRPPFIAENHIQLQKLIDNSGNIKFDQTVEFIRPSERMKLTYQISNDCIKLLSSLLKKNPLERISFEEFFSHSFLKLVDEKNTSLDHRQEAKMKFNKDSTKFLRESRRTNSQPAIPISITRRPSRNQGNKSITSPGQIVSISLGSSVATLPPFARLSSKLGTPPNTPSLNESIATNSRKLISKLSLSDSNSTFPVFKGSIQTPNMEDLKHQLSFINSIFWILERNGNSIEKLSSSSTLLTFQDRHNFMKFCASRIISLLENYDKTLTEELVSWSFSSLRSLFEQLENYPDPSISSINTFPPTNSSLLEDEISTLYSILFDYALKFARDGGAYELFSRKDEAVRFYEFAISILIELKNLVNDPILTPNINHCKNSINLIFERFLFLMPVQIWNLFKSVSSHHSYSSNANLILILDMITNYIKQFDPDDPSHGNLCCDIFGRYRQPTLVIPWGTFFLWLHIRISFGDCSGRLFDLSTTPAKCLLGEDSLSLSTLISELQNIRGHLNRPILLETNLSESFLHSLPKAVIKEKIIPYICETM